MNPDCHIASDMIHWGEKGPAGGLQKRRNRKTMKIAATYDKDNGTIFQHFGKTEFFKVYEVEEGRGGFQPGD